SPRPSRGARLRRVCRHTDRGSGWYRSRASPPQIRIDLALLVERALDLAIAHPAPGDLAEIAASHRLAFEIETACQRFGRDLVEALAFAPCTLAQRTIDHGRDIPDRVLHA